MLRSFLQNVLVWKYAFIEREKNTHVGRITVDGITMNHQNHSSKSAWMKLWPPYTPLAPIHRKVSFSMVIVIRSNLVNTQTQRTLYLHTDCVLDGCFADDSPYCPKHNTWVPIYPYRRRSNNYSILWRPRRRRQCGHVLSWILIHFARHLYNMYWMCCLMPLITMETSTCITFYRSYETYAQSHAHRLTLCSYKCVIYLYGHVIRMSVYAREKPSQTETNKKPDMITEYLINFAMGAQYRR